MHAAQTSIGSSFGPGAIALDVLQGHDLSGRRAVVTGVTSSLGLACALALRRAGATVFAGVCGPAAAAKTRAFDLETEPLDLLDPSAIDQFADWVLAPDKPVDILINQSGFYRGPLARDARGYEAHLTRNVLGHFQLTVRLWPALRAARGARVVMVSSPAHRLGGVDIADPHFEAQAYEPCLAFARSQSAASLLAIAIDERGLDQGVRAFAANPDVPPHPLVLPEDPSLPSTPPLQTPRKTADAGAACVVWCATNPELEGLGGLYCEDCDVATAVPDEASDQRGVRSWAADPVAAEDLWRLCETLTGVRFRHGGRT
jgi:NAD(P)-dependent dehydrogenase (short-subunit alcohol dehydrogenase family)